MAEDDAAWRGRIIDDRYLVEDVLGRGGMGVVLRARHRFTGAMVALKVLREDLAQDLDLQRRFLAEARASNAIAHPGIVEVLDAGRDASNTLYLAMELLVGESLRGPVHRRALVPSEVRRIGLELADILGAAHARGFVHRDLKPENVFLVAPNATTKLLDFGIAKVLTADVGTTARTAAGVVMGTPAYMAPEQLKDARTVDARADLWALGVMLYEMLTGRLPFAGGTYEEMFIAIASADPIPIRALLPEASPAVEAFFTRALAREPAQRFSSAAELAAAFAALPLVIGTAPVRATPPPASVVASGYATPGLAPTEMGTPLPGRSPAAVQPATRPPVQLVTPPPRAAPTAPGMTSLPGGTSPPVVHEGGSRNALWIGGAAAIAAAGVVIAYFATKPPAAPAPPVAPPVATVTVDAAPAVVAIGPAIDASTPVPPPIDAPAAAVAPRDAAAPPRATDAGHTVPSDAAPPAPADAARPAPPLPSDGTAVAAGCEAGCALATRCGLGYGSCAKACAARADVASCMRGASTCDHVAACGFLVGCGVVPRGRDTCNRVSAIQGLCPPGDPTCPCRAAATLAPQHAAALALYDACSASCSGNPACVAQRCGRAKAYCLSQ